MDFIEISAKTVDDAITKACINMETSSDNLEIQVVSEGSAGFLGFRSKPAVIKVRRKEAAPEVEKEVIKEPVKKPLKKEPVKEQKKEVKKELKKEPKKKQEKGDFSAAEEEPRKRNTVVKKTQEEIDQVIETAKTFLSGVFKAMKLPVEINTKYDNENANLDIDFSGEDMGVLIGKRGQTLDSLQYLTSLVVNRDQENYIRVKLDTENYRNRRKDTLENLARNIAYKVRKTRKSVSLEPMNPYERRIIHSSLQGNKYVETYSEGNEPYRHVVITLKK